MIDNQASLKHRQDMAIGVQFDPTLVRILGGSSTSPDMSGMLRPDFHKWLLENIGYGFSYPVRGWDQGISRVWDGEQEIRWIWYDDRLTRDERGSLRKWEKDGILIMFIDERQATYAKLTWGGPQ